MLLCVVALCCFVLLCVVALCCFVLLLCVDLCCCVVFLLCVLALCRCVLLLCVVALCCFVPGGAMLGRCWGGAGSVWVGVKHPKKSQSDRLKDYTLISMTFICQD